MACAFQYLPYLAMDYTLGQNTMCVLRAPFILLSYGEYDSQKVRVYHRNGRVASIQCDKEITYSGSLLSPQLSALSTVEITHNVTMPLLKPRHSPIPTNSSTTVARRTFVVGENPTLSPSRHFPTVNLPRARC